MASIETKDLKRYFSDLFYIDVASVSNTIQIYRSKTSMYEFRVKTELSLACNHYN